MNTTYRIQVNVKGGLPNQWKILKTVYGNERDVKDDCASLRLQWEDILEFRIIKMEVVE